MSFAAYLSGLKEIPINVSAECQIVNDYMLQNNLCGVETRKVLERVYAGFIKNPETASKGC